MTDASTRLEWMHCRLSGLAEINPEQLKDDTPADMVIDYIDLGAVEQVGHVPRPQRMRFGDAPSRARRCTRAGDILASTVRPYLRGFTRVVENGRPCNLVASTGYAVIRPKDSLDGDFVYQHVLSQGFLDHLVPRMTGSNYPAVNASDVEDYPLTCPPPEERRFIGMVLSSVDDAIDQTRAVIDQTRKLKSAMLADLLTNGLPGRHKKYAKHAKVGRYPADWKLIPLNGLIEEGRPICYGILMPGRGYPGGVPVIKVKDIRGGQIDESDILLTSPELDEEYRRSRLRTGDLLMTIRGSTGRVAIVPATLDRANITQDTARLSISDNITRDYLYYALQGHALQQVIQHHTIGQAVKGINIEEVRKLPIPLPAESERTQIVNLFHRIEDRLKSEHDLLARLIATKSALSQALLTGRVPVPTKGGE